MYSLPIVFPGLRREESYHQIANSLDYLASTTEDVFSRLESQLAANGESLANLNNRILSASAKVDKLKETKNKATTVFSVSKYPEDRKVRSLSYSFPNFGSHQPKAAQREERDLPSIAGFQPLDRAREHPQQEIFIVENGRRKSRRKLPSTSEQDKEGGDEEVNDLRLRHRDFHSVSSLLVFETNNFVDQTASRRKKMVAEESKQALDEAPASILTGEQIDQSSALTFAYVPSAVEVPEIDVPLTLPDLPDIATDVSYSHELPSIAPSANIPELPAIKTSGEATTAADTTEVNLSAPPPPPPPDKDTSAAAAAAPPSPPPPPPPPPMPQSAPVPPPPPDNTPAAPAVSSKQESAPPAAPPSSSGRGDLLESIRNAGGGKMKLRSAKERKLEKKKKSEQEEASSISAGGIFAIAALQAKLKMRREGISGKKAKADNDDDDGSVLSLPKSTEYEDDDWK